MYREENIFLVLNLRLRLKRTKEESVRMRREELRMSMARILLHTMNETRKGWKWISLLSRLMKDS